VSAEELIGLIYLLNCFIFTAACQRIFLGYVWGIYILFEFAFRLLVFVMWGRGEERKEK